MKFYCTIVELTGEVEVVNIAETEQEAVERTVDHLTKVGLEFGENFTIVTTEEES